MLELNDYEIRITARELLVKCRKCRDTKLGTPGFLPDGNYVWRYRQKPGGSLSIPEIIAKAERHHFAVHASQLAKH